MASPLTFGEKIKIGKSSECEELRRSIMELVGQLPEKIDGIGETRRLQWINTQMKKIIEEKKPKLNEKAAESSRNRANEYYTRNKEAVLDKIKNKRRKIREISRPDDA